MNRILFLFAAALCSCTEQPDPAPLRTTDRILAELHNPRSKNGVVVAHRGDWRNRPEKAVGANE